MLFVGKLDARNAQERIQGIREALAGSNLRITKAIVRMAQTCGCAR